MKNSGSFFIGMIAAATAGVVIGMLIAPEKGEDLRKKLRDSAGDWSKRLRDMLVEGKEHAEELKDEVMETTESLKNGKA